MRALCLVFVTISVVLAILNEEFKLTAIAYMMGISWGTLAGCFIGPFVFGLLSKRVTRPAVWSSIIGSLVLTVALIFILGYAHPACTGSFGSALQKGVSCSPLIGVLCMFYSLIVTPVVSLFTKAPAAEVIEAAFDTPLENEI